MRVSVYVDFDGTIAPSEPTDALFDKFADPAWREIEKEWQRGTTTSRDCMARQIAMLRATPDAVDAHLASVEVDPDFPAFVEMCHGRGMRVVVVSDGLDRVVRTVLRRAGLSLPVFANRMKWMGADRWTLDFPYARSDCRFEMGNCKCSHARRHAGGFDILVGDGRSDFCIAQRSGLVLAKGHLADECLRSGLNHVAIRDFADANEVMASWSPPVSIHESVA